MGRQLNPHYAHPLYASCITHYSLAPPTSDPIDQPVMSYNYTSHQLLLATATQHYYNTIHLANQLANLKLCLCTAVILLLATSGMTIHMFAWVANQLHYKTISFFLFGFLSDIYILQLYSYSYNVSMNYSHAHTYMQTHSYPPSQLGTIVIYSQCIMCCGY